MHTAARVLSTEDAQDYLLIITAFMGRLKCCSEMWEVVEAAGIAEEELIEFREKLEQPHEGPPLRRVS